MIGLRRSTTAPASVEPARQDVVGQDLAPIVDVLRLAASGDLEARVVEPGTGPVGELADMLNHLLDVNDAFVRESGAALSASSQGRFHRTLIERGLPGAYREGARRINASRDLMRDAAERSARESRLRAEIVGQAVEVSQHVAAASTELGASAQSLGDSVGDAVRELHEATRLVERLAQSSEKIDSAVTVIGAVAAQTRLLALNATIEAARAGAAGRAFSVVAGEVKSLSDDVAQSSSEIAAQVAAAQEAARDVVVAMERIASVISLIDEEAEGVATAAGHDEGGLARMAETLRSDIGRFTV
ncbi:MULTISPECIES: methyl-accepting chemotaxis protein [Cellulomonas]|uniref:Methyl-accepting transducer domain-containing protein n=2 Tax=Cellulomonas TaxID=1707 RepID=A0A4Y3KLY1_9CELL|nr:MULTISPECIES: methyl-accepting chemotaxis protein [Cellulomonas]GEA84394.1 hypothetical protein CGE01nite_16450 [Cellulomonas gelida]GGL26359.1 hypothetical protein GCM10009774_15980 [Cellulomonas gelida]